MTEISAKTILRSRNAAAPDYVLSTLLLRYPRFIHPEFMTHRVLSRNAASSRAIPVKKIIDDILADTATPLHWGKNQSGMQAQEECNSNIRIPELPDGFFSKDASRQEAWFRARDNAIEIARAFDAAGYHKQIVNRLLEPFAHITVLVSATEWTNFLELRDHPDAEPHMQMLAREISKCLDDESTVRTLEPGQWHMPFIDDEANDHWMDAYGGGQGFTGDDLDSAIDSCTKDLIKLSVARCASTSYKTVDGFDMTFDRAEKIFDKLVNSKPVHASPLEHVAMVDDHAYFSPRLDETPIWANPAEHRNFNGFRQYRAMVGA